MRAIILAGGRGERLRPLTDHLPKPMMPIIDKPILEYIIRLLRHHGIREIGITLGYKGDAIRDYFKSGENVGVRITYFEENIPLGTAGAIKNAEDYLHDDFIVISGDALTNIDLTSLIRYHKAKGGLITMAVKRVEDASRFGAVKMDRNGKIQSFKEKSGRPLPSLVNTGIYVMNAKVLDYIQEGVELDFSKDIFPSILSYMYGYISDFYWSDIGTLSDYYLANYYASLHGDFLSYFE